MKKNIVVFSLLLVWGMQAAWASKKITLKAGITQNRLVAKGTGHWMTGFALSAAGSFRLAKNFYWQPELLFIRKGDGNAFPLVLPDMKSRVSLDYLELPIQVRWFFMTKRAFRVALFGGGYFAFKLRADCRNHYGEEVWSESLKNEVKTIDLGVLLGIGFEKSLGKKRVMLDIRASLGLINADKLKQDVFNMSNWKNLSLALLFGFGF